MLFLIPEVIVHKKWFGLSKMWRSLSARTHACTHARTHALKHQHHLFYNFIETILTRTATKREVWNNVHSSQHCNENEPTQVNVSTVTCHQRRLPSLLSELRERCQWRYWGTLSAARYTPPHLAASPVSVGAKDNYEPSRRTQFWEQWTSRWWIGWRGVVPTLAAPPCGGRGERGGGRRSGPRPNWRTARATFASTQISAILCKENI